MKTIAISDLPTPDEVLAALENRGSVFTGENPWRPYIQKRQVRQDFLDFYTKIAQDLGFGKTKLFAENMTEDTISWMGYTYTAIMELCCERAKEAK